MNISIDISFDIIRTNIIYIKLMIPVLMLKLQSEIISKNNHAKSIRFKVINFLSNRIVKISNPITNILIPFL